MLRNKDVIDMLEVMETMFPDAKCELVYHNVFELSIATVLSAQTTDKSVNKVTPALFEKYPTPYELANANEQDVMNIIKTIGLYKNKSQNIIKFSKKLIDEFGGVVPKDFELLQTLPGVGRKTANVILTEGYKIPRLPVDTHVERVSKRLQIALADDSVLKVELRLMELIPESMWHKAHHLLLFFGRYFCFAKKPSCDNCPLKSKCINFNNKNTLL